MSTEVIYQIDSTSSEQTEQVGEQLGRQLRGREVIELISDLGGGKTTLVKGLAKAMGYQSQVTSPTFTIRKDYQGKKLIIYHYDFYRLGEAGLVEQELAEDLQDAHGVVVIEWGQTVARTLPVGRIRIELQPKGNDRRHLKIIVPGNLNYIKISQ